jgi:ABC-type phosphate transport system substrate-binding protein
MTHLKHPRLSAVSVLCCLAVLALAGAASAASTRSGAASTACGAVASGAHWKYKGQQGTKYSIIAVNGSRSLCVSAAKWMPRLSKNRATFQLKVAPKGWHCAAIGDYSGLAKMGQCTAGSAIIEWLPKLKK